MSEKNLKRVTKRMKDQERATKCEKSKNELEMTIYSIHIPLDHYNQFSNSVDNRMTKISFNVNIVPLNVSDNVTLMKRCINGRDV